MAIQMTDALLDRYLAGDCSPDEAAAVAEWLARTPVSANAIEWLSGQFSATLAPEKRQSWDRLSARLDADDRETADAGWMAYPARWARSLITAGAVAGAVGVLAIGAASVWDHARANQVDQRQGSLLSVIANDFSDRPLVDMAVRPSSDDLLDAVLQ